MFKGEQGYFEDRRPMLMKLVGRLTLKERGECSHVRAQFMEVFFKYHEKGKFFPVF